MKKFRAFGFLSVVMLALSVVGHGQRTEITISLGEQFFETVIDSVFAHAAPPEFSIAGNNAKPGPLANEPWSALTISYPSSFLPKPNPAPACRESITLRRDNSGVRTAVLFRDGRITAPLAFSGGYNPPLVGCVQFAGLADTNLDLEFDEPGQRLVARARVANVNLNGTGGIGGSVIARLVQSSIDRKINPIEMISLDKLSFLLPLQGDSKMRMVAKAIRPEVHPGRLDIHVTYEFAKAE